MTCDPDLVKSYAAPAPRYTSYPTAQQFHPGVTPTQYAGWLAELKDWSQKRQEGLCSAPALTS